MKRYMIFAVLVCMMCFSAFAQDDVVSIFKMPSARNAAIGGVHITNTDGAGALLNNPAGLVGKKEFGIIEISPSITAPMDRMEDIMDSVETIVDSGDDVDVGAILNLLKNITDDKGRLYVGLNVGAPISLSIVSGGFGFGLFTGAAVDVSFSGVSAKVNADVNAQVNIGYGHRFIETESHTLDVGIGLNAFYRVRASKRISMNDIASFDAESLLPLQGIFGLGMDVGVQYGFKDRLHVAVAANNLFSYARIMDMSDAFGLAGEGYTPFEDKNGESYRSLNVGMDYELLKKTAGFLDLTLMADYRDIFDLFSDIPRNPILNLGIGAELGLFDHIFIRAGLNDMLPALGVGFDLFVCELNFAAYGRELGLDPGVQPVFCMDLGLIFRW